MSESSMCQYWDMELLPTTRRLIHGSVSDMVMPQPCGAGAWRIALLLVWKMLPDCTIGACAIQTSPLGNLCSCSGYGVARRAFISLQEVLGQGEAAVIGFTPERLYKVLTEAPCVLGPDRAVVRGADLVLPWIVDRLTHLEVVGLDADVLFRTCSQTREASCPN